MSYKCRIATAMMALSVLAGCGRRPRPTTPEDPFRAIGVAPLAVGALAGAKVLLLPVGAVVLSDSAALVPDLVARRYTLRALAASVLDSTLRARAPDVTWFGLEEQRRALRMAPALGIEPERVETAYLLGPKVESMLDPLWSQVRALAGMTGARTALAPAAVRISRVGAAYTAEYVLVLVDSRDGQVLGRGRSLGPAAPTPEAALVAAAAAAVPPRAP
jgi:hypothetical protein